MNNLSIIKLKKGFNHGSMIPLITMKKRKDQTMGSRVVIVLEKNKRKRCLLHD